MVGQSEGRGDCRLRKCTTVLHGGVCHRTSISHKSGNKMTRKIIMQRRPPKSRRSSAASTSHVPRPIALAARIWFMDKSPMTSKSGWNRSDPTTMFMTSYAQERDSQDLRLYGRYRTAVLCLPVVSRFKCRPSSIPFPGVRRPNKSANLKSAHTSPASCYTQPYVATLA